MANFWWGQTEERNKIHWSSWATLCSPKCFGGLGFRDLFVFNDALLGRQCWRLIQKGDTLLSRVFKAKYYPHCDFLEAALGLNGSFSWRIIWSAKALVKEGLIWRVGDGTKIKIWAEPWITSTEGRFITSSRSERVMWVSDLIDRERKEWNHSIIEANFSEKDAANILAIPLSARLPKDELTWAYSKDGLYSVKTAYMLGKGCDLTNVHEAWSVIWSTEASPKVRQFLWRICTETLPVKGVLRARHLIEDSCCPWCLGEEESISHAIFGCWHSRDVWKECNCESLLKDVGRKPLKDVIAAWAKGDLKIMQRGVYVAWNIWMARNVLVFEGKQTPLGVITQRVYKQVEEYGKYTNCIYRKSPETATKSPNHWVPPPRGFIKMNVDAAPVVDGWVGLGVVARDEQGAVLFAATRRQRACWPPVIAEANDGSETGQKIWVSRGRGGVGLPRRKGNAVAHHLARLSPFGDEQVWEFHCPHEISFYVLMDTLILNEYNA